MADPVTTEVTASLSEDDTGGEEKSCGLSSKSPETNREGERQRGEGERETEGETEGEMEGETEGERTRK